MTRSSRRTSASAGGMFDRPKPIPPESVKLVALLDDLAFSHIAHISGHDGDLKLIFPQGWPEKGIAPPWPYTKQKHAKWREDPDELRADLRRLFKSLVAKAGCAQVESIEDWLLGTWSRIPFNDQALIYSNDFLGLRMIRNITPPAPMHGIAALAIPLEDCREEDGFNPETVFEDEHGELQCLIGPMRLVRTGCDECSNVSLTARQSTDIHAFPAGVLLRRVKVINALEDGHDLFFNLSEDPYALASCPCAIRKAPSRTKVVSTGDGKLQETASPLSPHVAPSSSLPADSARPARPRAESVSPTPESARGSGESGSSPATTVLSSSGSPATNRSSIRSAVRAAVARSPVAKSLGKRKAQSEHDTSVPSKRFMISVNGDLSPRTAEKQELAALRKQLDMVKQERDESIAIISEAMDTLEENKAQLEEATEEANRLRKELQTVQKDRDTAHSALQTARQSSTGDNPPIVNPEQSLKADIAALHLEVGDQKAHIRQLKNDMRTVEAERDTARTRLAIANDQIKGLNAQFAGYLKYTRQVESDAQKAHNEHVDIRRAHDDSKERLVAMRIELANLQKYLSRSQEDARAAHHERMSVQVGLDAAKESIAVLNVRVDRQLAHMRKLEGDLSRALDERDTARLSLAAAQDESAQTARRIADLQRSVGVLKEQRATLESSLDAAKRRPSVDAATATAVNRLQRQVLDVQAERDNARASLQEARDAIARHRERASQSATHARVALEVAQQELTAIKQRQAAHPLPSKELEAAEAEIARLNRGRDRDAAQYRRLTERHARDTRELCELRSAAGRSVDEETDVSFLAMLQEFSSYREDDLPEQVAD